MDHSLPCSPVHLVIMLDFGASAMLFKGLDFKSPSERPRKHVAFRDQRAILVFGRLVESPLYGLGKAP